jgi:hypothetical protein
MDGIQYRLVSSTEDRPSTITVQRTHTHQTAAYFIMSRDLVV